MKSFIALYISALTAGFFHFISFKTDIKIHEIPVMQDSVVTAVLCFTGDLMCHSTQFNAARVEADSFDFTGVFREVKPYLSAADLAIANLETVIAGSKKGYSGYPYFNAPDDFLYALNDAGYNLLFTANNHAIDQGAAGVERTIKKINEYGMHQTGTFVSEKDQDSLRIFQVHSIKIAFLAYTENTNGVEIPDGKTYLVNIIDIDKIAEDIAKARLRNVDIVLVNFHFGEEYKREPNTYQREIVDKTIELGADIIIGGHPHVIEPVDYFKTVNGNPDTGFVIYSMGNFISNQRWRYSDVGMMLNIEISKNIYTDSVYLSDVSFLPAWVYKGNTEKGREYIILPGDVSKNDSIYPFLTSNDKHLMHEAFEDTKYIVTRYTKNIKLISTSDTNYVRNEYSSR